MILYEQRRDYGLCWRTFTGSIIYTWRNAEDAERGDLDTRGGLRVSSWVTPSEARRSLIQRGHQIDNPGRN